MKLVCVIRLPPAVKRYGASVRSATRKRNWRHLGRGPKFTRAKTRHMLASMLCMHPSDSIQSPKEPNLGFRATACSRGQGAARILRTFSADVEKPWRACSRAARRRLQVFYTPREQPRKQGTPCDRDAGCARCPRRVCGRCPSFRFIEPGCPRFRSIGPGRPSFRFRG